MTCQIDFQFSDNEVDQKLKNICTIDTFKNPAKYGKYGYLHKIYCKDECNAKWDKDQGWYQEFNGTLDCKAQEGLVCTAGAGRYNDPNGNYTYDDKNNCNLTECINNTFLYGGICVPVGSRCQLPDPDNNPSSLWKIHDSVGNCCFVEDDMKEDIDGTNVNHSVRCNTTHEDTLICGNMCKSTLPEIPEINADTINTCRNKLTGQVFAESECLSNTCVRKQNMPIVSNDTHFDETRNSILSKCQYGKPNTPNYKPNYRGPFDKYHILLHPDSVEEFGYESSWGNLLRTCKLACTTPSVRETIPSNPNLEDTSWTTDKYMVKFSQGTQDIEDWFWDGNLLTSECICLENTQLDECDHKVENTCCRPSDWDNNDIYVTCDDGLQNSIGTDQITIKGDSVEKIERL